MHTEVIGQLQRHLKAAQSKRPGWAVGLWGEAGVGKTFTVQALLQESPLRSLSLHSTVSLQALAASLPRPNKLPLWAEHVLDRQAQNRAVEAQGLLDALAATLSQLAPFVLHLEDLHEANPERIDFIQKLARTLPRLRGVSLLITSRSEPPQPFKGYRLEALSSPDSDALLEAQAGGKLPVEGLEWVYGKARGNALFTLEFYRYLSRQGFFWSDGKSWHWKTPPEGFVPLSVEALIEEMMVQAADSAQLRAVLESRVMLPQNMDAPTRVLWASLAELDEPAFALALSQLGQSGLLSGDDFAHPLFREVVQGSIPAAQQKRLAHRAIELLQAASPEQAAALIEMASPQPTTALLLLKRAAASAIARNDPQTAGRFLAQAMKYAHGAERGELALEAEKALRPQGHLQTRIELLRTALRELSYHQGTAMDLAQTLVAMGQIEEARQIIQDLPSDTPEVWLKRQIVLFQRTKRHLEAIALWESHPQLQAKLLADLGLVFALARAYSESGNQQRSWEVVEQGLGQEQGEVYYRICLLDTASTTKQRQHDYQQAEHFRQEALKLAHLLADPDLLAMVLSNGSSVLRSMGRYTEMLEDLETALKLYAKAGRVTAYHNTAVMMSWVLIELGRYEQAETLLHQALEYLLASGPRFLSVICLLRLRHLYLDWNPPHGPSLARKYADMALEVGREAGEGIELVNGLVAVAICEATVGSAERALEVTTEGLEMLAKMQVVGLEVYMRLGRGMALGRLGQPGEALASFEQALKLLGEEAALEAQKIYLQIDRLRGDEASAQKRLAWFEQNGLVNAANLVRRYFPKLGASPAQAPAAEKLLQLKVLGTVQLVASGQPIAYRGKKRLELLCYLLEARLAGRTQVSVLELADTFYSEVSEEEAKRTLKQQMYLIRTSLGQDCVQSTQGGYALGNLASDAEEFLQTADPALWRGAYLDKLGEGWIGGVREALIQALAAKAQSLASPDPKEAFRLAQILIQMEPYDLSFLQLALATSQHLQPGKPTLRLYQEARERFLEVGESLPGLEVFMQTAAPV